MAIHRPIFLNILPVRAWQRLGRLIGYLLCIACLAALLYGVGAFGPVRAAEVGSIANETFTMKLTDAPCLRPDIMQFLAFNGASGDEIAKYKLALVEPNPTGAWARRGPFVACWKRVDKDHIFIMDEDGDSGKLPFAVSTSI